MAIAAHIVIHACMLLHHTNEDVLGDTLVDVNIPSVHTAGETNSSSDCIPFFVLLVRHCEVAVAQLEIWSDSRGIEHEQHLHLRVH